MEALNPLQAPIHYKSLSIFFGYLGLIISLFLICCHTIYVRYQARQKNNDWENGWRRAQFFLFTFLTALSIGMTWFYMISLFFYSYDSWANSPDGLVYSNVELPLLVRIGLWLKKTYLFQEAWEAVSENPTRVWWSGQIFGWTIGWGLFLGIAGRRYRIPRVWIYMLIGQCVSIAFAANLFFATITVSQRPNEKDISFKWYPPLLYELLPVVLSLVDALAVPIFAYEKDFMFVLLIPHILVFVPCLLGPIDSSKGNKEPGLTATQRYTAFLQWVAAASVAIQGYFTLLVVQDIGTDVPYSEVIRQLLDAIYVHPACSSVSWDVIICTVSAFSWALVHGFKPSRMLGGQ